MDSVDDFSYVGHEENFKRLSGGLVEKLEITKTIADADHAHEVKYLDRVSLWSNGVFKIEGDPKHRNILIKHCSGVDTCLTMSWSGLLKASAARKGEDQIHVFGPSRIIECGQGSFAIHECTKTGV